MGVFNSLTMSMWPERQQACWEGWPVPGRASPPTSFMLSKCMTSFSGAQLGSPWGPLLCVTCAPSSGRAVGLTSDSVFFRSSVFALHFTEPPISAQLLAFLRVFCMTEGKNHFRWKKKIFFLLNCENVKHCVCVWGVRLEIKILKWEELFGRGKLAILEKELICCAQGWQSPDTLRE